MDLQGMTYVFSLPRHLDGQMRCAHMTLPHSCFSLKRFSGSRNFLLSTMFLSLNITEYVFLGHLVLVCCIFDLNVISLNHNHHSR